MSALGGAGGQAQPHHRPAPGTALYTLHCTVLCGAARAGQRQLRGAAGRHRGREPPPALRRLQGGKG